MVQRRSMNSQKPKDPKWIPQVDWPANDWARIQKGKVNHGCHGFWFFQAQQSILRSWRSWCMNPAPTNSHKRGECHTSWDTRHCGDCFATSGSWKHVFSGNQTWQWNVACSVRWDTLFFVHCHWLVAQICPRNNASVKSRFQIMSNRWWTKDTFFDRRPIGLYQ